MLKEILNNVIDSYEGDACLQLIRPQSVLEKREKRVREVEGTIA